jgi:hypothetical protein
MRQDHVKYKGKRSSAQTDENPPSRQQATQPSTKRPPTATQSAPPHCVVPDPVDADLVVVIGTWRDLPEHIKTTIMSLIRFTGIKRDP